MDFVERIFGVSPDGGDGSLEVFWLLAIVLAVLVVVFRRRIGTWLQSRTATRR